jgi:hypothetical protein
VFGCFVVFVVVDFVVDDLQCHGCTRVGLKAYCVGDSMLCFMRCAIIWLLRIVSNTLAMIGRSDMGLYLMVVFYL